MKCRFRPTWVHASFVGYIVFAVAKPSFAMHESASIRTTALNHSPFRHSQVPHTHNTGVTKCPRFWLSSNEVTVESWWASV